MVFSNTDSKDENRVLNFTEYKHDSARGFIPQGLADNKLKRLSSANFLHIHSKKPRL
jgi:hypothetical protein